MLDSFAIVSIMFHQTHADNWTNRIVPTSKKRSSLRSERGTKPRKLNVVFKASLVGGKNPKNVVVQRHKFQTLNRTLNAISFQKGVEVKCS